MLIYIALALLAIIAIFLLLAARQPDEFKVSRSALLAAPQEVVFNHFNDLHLWNQWSPWARLDPNAKSIYEGPAAGVGASFGWSGSNKIGEGKMTITESEPHRLIRMRLEFIKPFTATNATEFAFHSEGSKTAVEWSMSGRNNLMGKAMGLLIDCEKMCGGQFEQGFENLRAIVEAPAQNQAVG